MELLGRWWRPPAEAQAVGGIFRFSQHKGLELELIGALDERWVVGELQTCPLILGVTLDGKQVSLTDCREAHRSHPMPVGFPHEQWSVEAAYVGAHFENPEELRFRKASMQFTYLREWARRFGLTWKPGEAGEQTITFSEPAPIEASTSLGKFSLVVTGSLEGDGLFRMGLEEAVSIDAETTEELSLEEWESRIVSPLQNLLTLATWTPNALIELTVYSEHSVHQLSNGKELQLPIRVLRQRVYHGEREKRLRHPSDMLFVLDDIAEPFSDFMERWLGVSERYRSVCELFFSVQYVPLIYAEHRFLNMVFACEIYHRSLAEGRIDLGRRLSDLIDRHRGVMEPLLADQKSFIDRVVATRKALVHGDPAQRQKAGITGTSLFHLAQTLAFLVRACFMLELGFSAEQVIKLFNRNREYRFAMQEAREASLDR